MSEAAIDVLASLGGQSAETVRLFAGALAVADPPLRDFAHPFDCWADALESPEITGTLALMVMKHRLRRAAFDPATPALIERLERADSPPWPQLAAGLRRECDALALAVSKSTEGAVMATREQEES